MIYSSALVYFVLLFQVYIQKIISATWQINSCYLLCFMTWTHLSTNYSKYYAWEITNNINLLPFELFSWVLNSPFWEVKICSVVLSSFMIDASPCGKDSGVSETIPFKLVTTLRSGIDALKVSWKLCYRYKHDTMCIHKLALVNL